MVNEIVNSISNLPESKHLYEDVCHIIVSAVQRLFANQDCVRSAYTI